MHWFSGIVIVLFGNLAMAQEQEQTPVCYDMNADVDVEENVCFPRIAGYSLRTVSAEGPWEDRPPNGYWDPAWYGGIWRTATAYYAAADPQDQLESRVLGVSVHASAGFPLQSLTRNPRPAPGANPPCRDCGLGRWGYERRIEVSAYLMTAAHDDPNQQGLGCSHAYQKVVLRDNGNLVIEDCPYSERLKPATVSGGGAALAPRVAHDTDCPIKVSRMIRRYLEREAAPAACGVE